MAKTQDIIYLILLPCTKKIFSLNYRKYLQCTNFFDTMKFVLNQRNFFWVYVNSFLYDNAFWITKYLSEKFVKYKRIK